jgi:hypothetical protein
MKDTIHPFAPLPVLSSQVISLSRSPWRTAPLPVPGQNRFAFARESEGGMCFRMQSLPRVKDDCDLRNLYARGHLIFLKNASMLSPDFRGNAAQHGRYSLSGRAQDRRAWSISACEQESPQLRI